MAKGKLASLLKVAGGLALAAPGLAACDAICGACGACSAYSCKAHNGEGAGCGACGAHKDEAPAEVADGTGADAS
ncbi:hypothetical protein ACXYL9_00465 [Qipengyuania sp. CAU 1752]